MQMKLKIWALVLGVVLVCTSECQGASAGLLFVNFTGETVVAGNSFFSYDLSLGGSASNSVELQTNDFATIIDFGPANPVVGYSGAFIADWSVSQNLVGPIPTTPLNLNPVANDNPTVLDLDIYVGSVRPLP